MLHHDNAPCHMAISVIEFLAKKGIPVVPQPPYSPDLSPCNFFLFPKLMIYLEGRHFGTVENIEKAVTDQLKAIPVSEFQHCYKEWEQRLKSFVSEHWVPQRQCERCVLCRELKTALWNAVGNKGKIVVDKTVIFASTQ